MQREKMVKQGDEIEGGLRTVNKKRRMDNSLDSPMTSGRDSEKENHRRSLDRFKTRRKIKFEAHIMSEEHDKKLGSDISHELQVHVASEHDRTPTECNISCELQKEGKDFRWTEEETLALLDRIEEQFPTCDRVGYRAAQRKLDWDSLSSSKRSGEECKQRYFELIARHLKAMTLRDMLGNLRRLLDEGQGQKHIQGPSTISIFLKRYLTPEWKAEIQAKQGKVTTSAWRRLPEDGKQNFKRQALAKRSKYKCQRTVEKKMSQKKFQLFITPYKIWLQEQMAAAESNKKNLTQKYFTQLCDEEKVPYITTSLQLYYQHFFLREDKKLESTEEREERKRKERRKAEGPPKADLLIYLLHKGMPPFPPTKVTSFFFTKLLETRQLDAHPTTQEKLREALALYRLLSSEQKKKYVVDHTELLRNHKLKLKEWINKQEPITVFALHLHSGNSLSKYLNQTHTVQTKVKRNLKHTQEEVDKLFSNSMSHCFMSCPKFQDEPQLQPSTPFQVFALKFRQITEGKFASEIEHKVKVEKWRKMDAKARLPFVLHYQRLRDNYRSEILEYVSSMNETMRSIYLGFNRSRHFHHFKEDIFRDAFPNKKYPVYVKESNPHHGNSASLNGEGEESNHSECDISDTDENSDGVNMGPENLYVRGKTNRLHSKTDKNIPHTRIQHDQSEKITTYSPRQSDMNERLKGMSASWYPKREESGSSDECDGAVTTHSGTRGVQYHSESSTDSRDEGDMWNCSSIAPIWKTAQRVSFLSSLQHSATSDSDSSWASSTPP